MRERERNEERQTGRKESGRWDVIEFVGVGS